MIKIKIEREIDPEVVANAMVGALEQGASAGWCQSAKMHNLPNFTKGDGPWYAAPSFWTSAFEVRVNYDDPDGEEGAGTGDKIIGPKHLEEGLQVMAEKYPRHFDDLVEGNDDAITHDVLFQCIVIGEVTYG